MIVVGAGVSSIYQIKRLVDLGIVAVVPEPGDDLGGTWYHNRYPGAQLDSKSYTYGNSFSKELLEEWLWLKVFAAAGTSRLSELRNGLARVASSDAV